MNREKYDRAARDFSHNTYANLEYYMKHRFDLATRWGPPLEPGDSVLELGCGDGSLAGIFARGGYRYTGLDFSAGMVRAARERSEREDFPAKFVTGDINQLDIDAPYDGVLGFMRTFFHYSNDHASALSHIAQHAKKKVIVDLDPRTVGKEYAIDVMKEVGLRNIRWRPFIVPSTAGLPSLLLKALTLGEVLPGLRTIPLRWKFNVLLVAEP